MATTSDLFITLELAVFQLGIQLLPQTVLVVTVPTTWTLHGPISVTFFVLAI